MYCPQCKKNYEKGVFCSDCIGPDGGPVRLLEDPQTPDFGVNFGNGFAVDGNINVTRTSTTNTYDQRNISNTTVNNNYTTKSDKELMDEKINQFYDACMRAYEDTDLSFEEETQLNLYRDKLGLDAVVAKGILDKVKNLVLRNAKEKLSRVAKNRLERLSDALHKNDVHELMQQIDNLEEEAGRCTNDELQYKYYLVLAALKSEKCVNKYETFKAHNYWKSFWSCLAYRKIGKREESERILNGLDTFTTYPEDNMLLLAAACALMDNNKYEAKAHLSGVAGEYSPALQCFADTVFLLGDPALAEGMGVKEESCAFYLINFFNKKPAAQVAEEEAKLKAQVEAKRQAEEQAKLQAEEEAKRKAEEEAQQRAQTEAASLQEKWTAMAHEAYKCVLHLGAGLDTEDIICGALNMCIPPAMAGNAFAMAFCAFLYGLAGKEDEAKAWGEKLMTMDPQNQDPDVMYAKGIIYEEGLSHYEQNTDYALAFYKAAASMGHMDAAYDIAQMYYKGELVPQDDNIALQWAKIAYDAKHPAGIFFYGLAYYEGRGLPKNRLMGKQLIEQAAASTVYSKAVMEALQYIEENFK
jgi:TPR repeat protein